MRKWFWAGAAVLILTLSSGAVLVYRFILVERSEQVHYDLEETLLLISNPAQAATHLFKAGKTLQEAAPVEPFDGVSIWLARGNYFLQVEQQGKKAYYPIPIIGYRSGPDRDGTLIVTIRSLPAEDPPLLTPGSVQWAYIPSGHFLIGNNLNPREPHYVWLPAFFMAIFEVTNAQYKQFLEDPQGFKDDANWSDEGRHWKSSGTSHATAPLPPADPEYKRFGQEDQPVVQVNWFEATAFCHWLTRTLGNSRWQFSLPSEVEWEKAARSPDNFEYGLGMTLSDNEISLYNWRKNPSAATTVVGYRESVGSYLPNRYGLLHMSGNVAEWTLSVNRPYNKEHPYVDDDRNSENVQGLRVLRGGSWYTASIAVLSVSYRETFQPDVNAPYLGFRIVARLLP